MDERLRKLSGRITRYLTVGGMWDPELANHDAVRDLLIDCRECLETLSAQDGGRDDEEPVTREWAESIGGHYIGAEQVAFSRGLDEDFQLVIDIEDGDTWLDSKYADCILPYSKTRGQVRRLLSALVITPESKDKGDGLT